MIAPADVSGARPPRFDHRAGEGRAAGRVGLRRNASAPGQSGMSSRPGVSLLVPPARSPIEDVAVDQRPAGCHARHALDNIVDDTHQTGLSAGCFATKPVGPPVLVKDLAASGMPRWSLVEPRGDVCRRD
jgi:hypothetical protein